MNKPGDRSKDDASDSRHRPTCLITGVGGLLGSYMAELLLDNGAEVCGTYHRDKRPVEHLEGTVSLLPCDMLDRDQVEAIVRRAHWDFVFHFAAQSLPTLSWKDPELTFRVNLFGTLYLLDAIRNATLYPRVLIAGSSAEYGPTGPDEALISETSPLCGNSPYGVAKVAAELLSDLYVRTYALEVITVRPFFVIGPRKVGDVCSDLARGVVAIENGERSSLAVGNLGAVRDFVDVRDAVRACWLVAEKGQPGQAYNLCSGVGREVREVLDILCSYAKRPVPVEKDDSRARIADAPRVVGDNSRLVAIGWRPQISLEQSLADILAYWRTARA